MEVGSEKVRTKGLWDCRTVASACLTVAPFVACYP
jgi:hypothetical protein